MNNIKDRQLLKELRQRLEYGKKSEKERIKARITLEEHKKLSLVGKIAGKMAHDV